jgi:hypothetical protein
MTEKEQTETVVLDEEIVREIVEGEGAPPTPESRLVRLKRGRLDEEDDDGADQED